MIVAAVGLVIAAFAFSRTRELRPHRTDRVVIAALLALALALRLWLGLWAPLHINGQGPLWIGAAAVRPAMLAAYGPGYPEVFSAITALARGSPDVAIFTANAVGSSAIPVLAFALARIAGLERDRALFGAAVLAIDPIAVRFSASESYFVSIAVLTLASSTAIAAAVRVRSRLLAGAWIFAAALFAMQAARIHPVAWVPVGLCPLAALLGGPGVPLSRRLAWLVVALVVLTITISVTSAASLAGAADDATRYAQGISHRIGRPIVIVLIGLAFAIMRARHWPLVLVGALSLAIDLVLRPIYGQSDVWQACFDRLFLAMPILAAAAAIPLRWFHGRLRLVWAAAVLVLAARIAWSVPPPTTEQIEYRWLRDQLARLDGECRVASVSRAGRRVLYLPWYVMAPQPERTPARWFSVASPVALAEAARHGRCLRWVHTSLCDSEDGRPLCGAIESAVTLTEIASLEIDAVPSARDYAYDAPIVRVGMYEVTPR